MSTLSLFDDEPPASAETLAALNAELLQRAQAHPQFKERIYIFGEGAAGARAQASPAEGARENEVSMLDRRLRGYAMQRARLDAAEAFDLSRAYELKIHALCGYATFFEYMERALGYAPHTARERLRVARELRRLPMTALTEGRSSR